MDPQAKSSYFVSPPGPLCDAPDADVEQALRHRLTAARTMTHRALMAQLPSSTSVGLYPDADSGWALTVPDRRVDGAYRTWLKGTSGATVVTLEN